MILTIDMGNSNIVIGGIDDSQTYFVERVTTNRGKTDLEYAVNIKSILEIHNVPVSSIEGAILSSVVSAAQQHHSLRCRENLWFSPHACRLWHENWSEHHHG